MVWFGCWFAHWLVAGGGVCVPVCCVIVFSLVGGSRCCCNRESKQTGLIEH